MKRDTFVSVVAPVSDLARLPQEFVHVAINTLQAHYTNYELILVDAGSPSPHGSPLRDWLSDYDCLRVLRLRHAAGLDAAISAGLEQAIGDLVVAVSPESDPPELIPTAVEYALAGHDLVLGIQTGRRPHAGQILISWYCRRWLGAALPPNHSHYAVLSRRLIATLLQSKERSRHLPIVSLSLGFPHCTFSYEPIGRPRVRPSWREAGSTLLDLVVARSRHPLRIVTWVGMVASLLNASYSLYIVGVYLFAHRVAQGWTTLSLQISLMFFFVFLILIVACEYLGQLLFESSARPPYFLVEEHHSSAMLADRTRRNLVSDEPD